MTGQGLITLTGISRPPIMDPGELISCQYRSSDCVQVVIELDPVAINRDEVAAPTLDFRRPDEGL
jgi:hypothetical protein